MSRGTLTSVAVFGIAILVVIAGFFLLGFEHIAINFWALGSLVFSLLVSLLGTIILTTKKTNKDELFYNAGIGSLIWIYQIIVIISVLFAGAYKENLNGFIFTQIAINSLLVIVGVVIVMVSGHISDSNAKTLEKLNRGDYNTPKRGGF